MQIIARKTFNGRAGLVRTGVILTVDDKYGAQLVKSGLADVHVPKDMLPEQQPENGPQSNTNLGDAPKTKGADAGNESSDDEHGPSSQDDATDKETESPQDPASGSMDSSSAARPAGGKTRPLSSPLAARRSRRRT